MTAPDYRLLKSFLEHLNTPQTKTLLDALPSIVNADQLLEIYHQTIPLFEQEMWSTGINQHQLEAHQKLFHEMEQLIATKAADERHHIVIVIPVADRPQHLRDCLNSLLELCQRYPYGKGKVSVLIADDSRQPENITQHGNLAEKLDRQGITIDYFGLKEQIALINRLSSGEESLLTNIIGSTEPAAFYHKGASLMRNITYLKLNDYEQDKSLFYFVDSDQEFKVNIPQSNGYQELYAIHYFYHLDRLFSRSDAIVLTGKVVGDPPVSPSVMAGNFLDDVCAFLSRMTSLSPEQPCSFHSNERKEASDAAYHDMAELFGFTPKAETYSYSCPLTDNHSHADCFMDFASKINRFFDGEHPTRKTWFEFEDISSSCKPARTVYTGNYVFKPIALKYFIPFANLKLRMAGPVLGRIIKAEAGPKFVSANLPMLHKRTVAHIGQSEFRPGISRQIDTIDLSIEFERQFFGDVLLFSVERLTEMGYPGEVLAIDAVVAVLRETSDKLLAQYMKKQELIKDKLGRLRRLLDNPSNWWHTNDLEQAVNRFRQFLANIEANFGPAALAYQLINDEEHRQARYEQMVNAIMAYPEDRTLWQNILDLQNKSR